MFQSASSLIRERNKELMEWVPAEGVSIRFLFNKRKKSRYAPVPTARGMFQSTSSLIRERNKKQIQTRAMRFGFNPLPL
ncbi:hypothetical protein LEP1GSC073_4312 [Leptospira noguchii str. Cascata]|nr:hypothetical protein LEP1GSC073_4312 [Leptospira noguchii str. Cascata]